MGCAGQLSNRQQLWQALALNLADPVAYSGDALASLSQTERPSAVAGCAVLKPVRFLLAFWRESWYNMSNLK